jgi:hypothetical protein
MSLSTGVALLIRFFKGGLSKTDIRAMTFEQFFGWLEEIGNICELESGETKVSGKEAIAMAMSDPAIRKV